MQPALMFFKHDILMNDEAVARLLQELVHLQKQQLATLESVRETQLEHVTLYRSHLDRVEKINDKTEQIQQRSESIMGSAGKIILAILIVVIALLLYIGWILFLR